MMAASLASVDRNPMRLERATACPQLFANVNAILKIDRSGRKEGYDGFFKFILKHTYQMLRVYNTPTASLQRSKTPLTTSVLVYDTKQFYGEAPVMLELWGMRSILLLPSLCPGVVTPNWALSKGQIELFDI